AVFLSPEAREFIDVRGTNEGIGFTFLFDGGRNGHLPGIAQLLDSGEPSFDRRIFRHSMSSEPGIRKRIFVCTVKARVIGQSSEPLERAVHLFRSAFEQAAAAHS